jgi:lysophospholipase L1-like esterase
MKTFLKAAGIVFLGLLAIVGWYGYKLYGEIENARSDDPLVWEGRIAAFEQQPVLNDALLFTGSSSIRFWSSLERDMSPAPVIQRGFGGAKINDMVHYADRLVAVPSPAAILVFAGTNDISLQAVKPAADIAADWLRFVARVRQTHPDVLIYYIAITPSIRRWEVWPQAQDTNQLIEAAIKADPLQHFINTGSSLLDEQGMPNPELYIFDGLHLNAEGYKRWTQVIRGRLLADGLIPVVTGAP